MNTNTNIGRIARCSNGEEGIVTRERNGTLFGVKLNGSGRWQSKRAQVVNYSNNARFAVNNDGRIGIVRSVWGNDGGIVARGIGLDGKNWASRVPTYIPIKEVRRRIRQNTN